MCNADYLFGFLHHNQLGNTVIPLDTTHGKIFYIKFVHLETLELKRFQQIFRSYFVVKWAYDKKVVFKGALKIILTFSPGFPLIKEHHSGFK